jgi:WD40 repeat protein
MFSCSVPLLAAAFALAQPTADVPRATDERPAALALIGHTGAVHAVAFAKTGKAVATAGADGTIRIWNPATGDQVRKLQHAGKPAGVAFSPDGKMLAAVSVGKAGELAVWEVAGPRKWRLGFAPREQQLSGGGGLAFSADGRIVIAGLPNGFLSGFQNSSGRMLFADDHVQGVATMVAVSPNGKTLAAGYPDGTIEVLESANGKFPLASQVRNSIRSLAFLPDGTRVAAANGSSSLRILYFATGREESGFESKEPIDALCISGDCKILATSGRTGTVSLWDSSGKRLRQFSADGPVSALALDADGKQLATAGPLGVILWDLTRNEESLPRDFQLSPKDVDLHWAALAGHDGRKVYAAARLLRADAARSVPFLQKQFAPKDTGPEASRLKQFVADLDSDEFATREAATNELAKLGPAAESEMRQALASRPSLEVVRRLERLLQRLDEQVHPLSAEQQRDVRAVRVLEQVATPEAKKLLTSLSKKGPGWWVEREAKEALERMGRGVSKR